MSAPESILLNWLLLFPIIAAAMIGAFPLVLRFVPAHERASALTAPAATAISAIGLSLAVAAAMGAVISRGGDAFADYLWTPDFFQFRTRLDALGLYCLVAVLGALMLTSLWAAAEGLRDHIRWAAFIAAAGAFTGVVLAADLVLLYMFWELAGLALWAALAPPREVGRRFLTWNHAGGLGILLAILWVAILSRDTHIYSAGSGLLVHQLSSVKWIGLVLVLGLGVRLAQVPLHFWMPALCRGTQGKWNLALLGTSIVVAGYAAVRLIFYILPNYAAAAVAWLPIATGMITAAYAASRALLSRETCRTATHVVIAAGGQVALGIGLGMQQRTAALAGALALLAPLALTAALLAASLTDMPAGPRMSRARATATIAAAWTLSGLPPLAGFWGHRAIAGAAWDAGGIAVLLAALIAPVLIFAYGVKQVVLSFGRQGDSAPEEQGWRWWWVGGVVAVSLALGALPKLWWPYLLEIARKVTGG